MKQFFKILALAALALPFTGCDVEYSDINILPDPVFEQNGLYTVNTISIYDDYETVINVSRTAGLSKELELDIVVDETLLAEYNELYNTDYKLLEHSEECATCKYGQVRRYFRADTSQSPDCGQRHGCG